MAGYFKSLFSGQTITPTNWGNTVFIPLDYANDLIGGNNYLKDFLEIPELNAIINIRARAMSNWILSIQSKQTGKEVTQNESLVRILRSPNWFQGQTEYWKHTSILHDIWGNEFIYFLKPFAVNTYAGMFSLDPAKVEIKYNTKNLYFLEANNEAVEYWYNTGSEKIKLDKENLIHLNDNRVQPEKFLEGTSKIESLQAPLQNIREAYKKRNKALKMPIGIMSNGTNGEVTAVPMTPEEKTKLKAQVELHGSAAIFTNQVINWDDMTINPSNMGLYEEVREDTAKICDAYGVPYEMLASQKGVTFANLKEAKKQFYEETIIPDAKEKTDALNLYLDTDKRSWHIVADFKHLPVFAEDVKQRAISLKQVTEALSKMLADGAITIEDYQAELQKFGIG